MKHASKRLLSLLLALILVIGLIPGTASAVVNLTGTWQTDLTMSAADLGVNARTGMNITAFSPPYGDLFSCRAIPTVPGQHATFTFDVSVQHLQESGLTLNFYDHTYGPAFGMIDLFRNENEAEIA